MWPNIFGLKWTKNGGTAQSASIIEKIDNDKSAILPLLTPRLTEKWSNEKQDRVQRTAKSPYRLATPRLQPAND